MKCLQQERYNELIEAEKVLNSLYAAGVDSWDGWGATLELLEETRRIDVPLDIGEK
jgi:hypothetical protein